MFTSCSHRVHTVFTGPELWPSQYPRCGGRRQSPIDIKPEGCQYDSTLSDFQLSNFEQLSDSLGVGQTLLNFTNNGHAGEFL